MTHVIIPCGAKKARSGRPASPLYEGPYFRTYRDWARSVAGDDHIRILSAKHGFVSLSASLEPNDTRFGQEGRISDDELARQAKALGWRPSAVIVLGGVHYVRAARHAFPEARALSDTIRAEAGGAGVGRQIGWLRMNRSRLPL